MNYKQGYHILIVDDEIEYQKVFALILRENGYLVTTSSNGTDAIKVLQQVEIDLVMTDLKMPGMDGMELIKQIKNLENSIEIIVLTAFGSIESAVEAIKLGATSYFVKSSQTESLLVDIDRIAKTKMLERSNSILKEQRSNAEMFLDTKNYQFANILDSCKKAANSEINVLLLGESGVGKEVIANYIHKNSERKKNHFIAVNCQVFADGMLESELFGHEKGAFTGALNKRIGRFEAANFGTIFLDEIGDLPLSTQGKLLRVLESKSIERVGSNKSIELDIRLIAATNKDLEKEIRLGNFREDLLYRINTLTLTIPPLRKRKEDLPLLIEYFLNKTQSEQKKKITSIDEQVNAFLLEYNYPGNIRELKNILERFVALSDNGVLRMHDVKLDFANFTETLFPITNESITLKEARAQFEKVLIKQTLDKHHGNVPNAAISLGITKRQLWNKISEYNIKRG